MRNLDLFNDTLVGEEKRECEGLNKLSEFHSFKNIAQGISFTSALIYL